jgi:hypothetical protein
VTPIDEIFQEIRCFVDSKTLHPASRHGHSRGADVRSALLADLRLFDPHFSEGEARIGETVVTKQTAWALSHFLMEFPHALSRPLSEPSDGSASSRVGSWRELLRSHLDCLLSLRHKQCDTAKRCRASDSLRGRKIIFDYDQVHPSTDSDEVLLALEAEVQTLATEVEALFGELVD